MRPVIHCLTNHVTAGRVADAIAAAGGAPIMAASEAEAAAVAANADAVVLNCGTPDPERVRALCAAGAGALAAHVPIVLDPVGCGVSDWRTASIRGLAAAVHADVVRGGVAEIAALLELPTDARLRGVGSTGGDEAAIARAAASRLDTVVVVGGIICDRERTTARAAGPAMLGRVVGAGDVLDALIALACVGEADRFRAAEAAHARFTAAAFAAAERGPGSFWPAFVDALARG